MRTEKDRALVDVDMDSEYRLFYLVDGRVLYSDDYIAAPEGFEFNTARTLGVQMGHGQVQVAKIVDVLPGKPSRLMVPKTSVALVTDVSDQKMIEELRGALSGLVLVK